MKHFCTAVFVVGSFFLFGIQQAALAQVQEVSYSDISKMERTTLGLLRSIPYRMTRTAETFPERGKEASWKGVLIVETNPPDRSRQISVTTTQGKSERWEIVSISGRHYQRFNDGPWQVLPPPPPPKDTEPKNAPASVGSRPKIEAQAQLVETLTEKGRLVSVYDTKSTTTREVDGKEVVQIVTSKYWFRDDGMLLKKVSEIETLRDPKIVKNTTVYEYEDIKVEAPTVNQ